MKKSLICSIAVVLFAVAGIANANEIKTKSVPDPGIQTETQVVEMEIIQINDITKLGKIEESAFATYLGAKARLTMFIETAYKLRQKDANLIANNVEIQTATSMGVQEPPIPIVLDNRFTAINAVNANGQNSLA